MQALPEDVNHETGLEKVIAQVASFKKPTAASGKGVYELKVGQGHKLVVAVGFQCLNLAKLLFWLHIVREGIGQKLSKLLELVVKTGKIC